jgi:structure-specific endonuclease subunit SLX1
MVPRGGHCKSCKEYTLWGDVIRGCYQRMRSHSVTGDQQLSEDLEVQETKSSMKRKKSGSPRRRKSSKLKESQESFSSSMSKPRRSRKSQEVLSLPPILGLPSESRRKQEQTANSVFTTEGKNLDLVASPDIEGNATPMKRKRGRPRKSLAILSPGALSSVSSPHSVKASRKPKKSASPPTLLGLAPKGSKERKRPTNSVCTTEGESLDLVVSSKIEDNATPMKRKRGRPRKVSSGASPTILGLPPKDSRKRKQPANSVFTTEDENLDLVGSEIEDNATPMK